MQCKGLRRMIKLGMLSGSRGTNFLAILKAIEKKDLAAKIEIVISNKADAHILQHAAAHHLPAQFINPHGLTRTEYDQKTSKVLQDYSVDLVVLSGYMRILSVDFIAAWEHKIINVHPSLLPAFGGLMDLQVHRAVLQSGVKETGCTVHHVTQTVDSGPILLQKKCAVLSDDTPESLKKRVQELEGEALIDVIQGFKFSK